MMIASKVIGGVLVLWLLAFFAMGWWSGKEASTVAGLVDAQLQPCPSSPNCVCSESADAADGQHSIEPIKLNQSDAASAMQAIEQVVTASGGQIVQSTSNYMHATFTSRMFRFVDDVEFRLHDDVLHLRSASRVGYSDLGVNAERIARLRQDLAAISVE